MCGFCLILLKPIRPRERELFVWFDFTSFPTASTNIPSPAVLRTSFSRTANNPAVKLPGTQFAKSLHAARVAFACYSDFIVRQCSVYVSVFVRIQFTHKFPHSVLSRLKSSFFIWFCKFKVKLINVKEKSLHCMVQSAIKFIRIVYTFINIL